MICFVKFTQNGQISIIATIETALETSRTLNSQVGTQLLIIAESKNLLGDITCIPSSVVGKKFKHSIEEAALHLHETTVGRQMFTLFQIDRAIPY